MQYSIHKFLFCVYALLPATLIAEEYPLHAAIRDGVPSRVREELWSSRLNQRNGADQTPLMVAAMNDRSTSARLVLEAGARVDEETVEYGATALMMASQNGYHEVVELLLS